MSLPLLSRFATYFTHPHLIFTSTLFSCCFMFILGLKSSQGFEIAFFPFSNPGRIIFCETLNTYRCITNLLTVTMQPFITKTCTFPCVPLVLENQSLASQALPCPNLRSPHWLPRPKVKVQLQFSSVALLIAMAPSFFSYHSTVPFAYTALVP